MKYNFDQLPERRNTLSYKWDQSKKLFGADDILPLWVADMDFYGPPEVTKAIVQRAEHGIYGYTVRSESYIEAITGWFQRRHQWTIQPEWLTDTPGIVPALSIAVQCFSEPGDSIILQAPVYYPFYDVIQMNDRQVVKNTLQLRNGRYEMNFEQLEEQMKAGAKMLLLCSPHNPGGRVWTLEELTKVGELCLKYNVIVVSDEIHCDHVYSGHKHIPFASIREDFADITVTTLATSKSFNLPGIQSAFVVISNSKLKRVFDYRVKTLSLHMASFFAPVATEACYNYGEEWMDELLVYLEGNLDYAIDYMKEHMPQLTPIRSEGTYLLWVNCRKLGLTVPELKDLMFKKAKVAFSEGSVFCSEEGKGFLRINLACPRSVLVEALERFKAAIDKIES